MKTYQAPALTIIGSAIELTQGVAEGNADGGGTQLSVLAGSVGFNL